MSRQNFVQVQLAAAATDIQTTLSVKVPTGGYTAPPPDGGRLIITDSPGRPSAFEVVTYTGRTGAGPYTLTGVTRGVEGTVGLAWAEDTFVLMGLTAGEFDAVVSDLQSQINAKAASDDTRLTDSREWVAATVSQTEATAGTATVRRAWTAERVAQAVRGGILTGLSTSTGGVIAATDTVLSAMGKLQKQITDAASNLAANVRAVALTGLSTSTGGAIAATDTVLSAMGKLQKQISDAASNLAANVRATVLTGMVTTNASNVTEDDSVLVAIGKLQALHDSMAYGFQTEVLATNLGGSLTLIDAPLDGSEGIISAFGMVQGQLDNKAPKDGTGATGTWPIAISGNAATATTLSGLTATVAELNYCDGVTSNIQTQLNGKASSTHTHAYLPTAGGNITGATNFADSVQAQFGTGDDLIIYHNGSHSYIDQNVTGDLFIRNNRTGGRILIYADDSEGTSQIQAQFGYGTNNAVLLCCGGVTRFQTTAAGATVNGAFTATGDITAYSDIRLKTDIQVIPDALAKVQALRGVTYERVDTGEHQTGVIAQDVQAVLPEAVQDDGQYLSVAYGNLVGLLIEAVKELTARVEELENGAA